MSEASIKTWLAEPMDRDVVEAIERLRRAPDVQHVAVMPDVHLAAEVCIGVAIATSHLLYPQAVGGDIGCGMLAVAVDGDVTLIHDPPKILSELAQAVPTRRRNRTQLIAQPDASLSHPKLETLRLTEGALEFATLGSGNHFLELQTDDQERLWLMIHSGSRALGQAIQAHHLAHAQPQGSKLRALDASSPEGEAYLRDVDSARNYAAGSRKAIAEQAAIVLGRQLCWETAITTDHNHVSHETHYGRELWIHRKGAMPAHLGEPGVLPGSMATRSFHVEGRGHPDSLCSSAHGAGRALSRTAARTKVSARELQRQMQGIWFNAHLAEQLRDEAPSAYKDIRAVLRAQKDILKVTRTLHPVLNYKGT